MKHSTALLLALLVSVSGIAADEVGKCPLSGNPGKAEFSLFQEGKALNFCCGMCLAKFRKTNENQLTAAEKKAGWKLLFNGKNLEGFQKPTRDGKWSVVKNDGVLRGTEGKGVLASKDKFDNFELKTDVRIQDTGGERRGNSGIFIRSTGLTAYRGRWPDGHEVQLDHGDPAFWTGSLFKTAAAKKVETKDGKWLTMRIRAQGKSIKVWVDEKLVLDFTDKVAPVAGPISFQVHHVTDLVEFKNVKIRKLSAK